MEAEYSLDVVGLQNVTVTVEPDQTAWAFI